MDTALANNTRSNRQQAFREVDIDSTSSYDATVKVTNAQRGRSHLKSRGNVSQQTKVISSNVTAARNGHGDSSPDDDDDGDDPNTDRGSNRPHRRATTPEIILVNYTKYIIVFMNALNVTGSIITNIKIECNTNNNITLIQ